MAGMIFLASERAPVAESKVVLTFLIGQVDNKILLQMRNPLFNHFCRDIAGNFPQLINTDKALGALQRGVDGVL